MMPRKHRKIRKDGQNQQNISPSPPFAQLFELGWLSLLFFRSQRGGATVLNCCSAIAYFGASMCKAAVLLWPALLTLLRWTRRNRGNRKNCNEGCPLAKGLPLISVLSKNSTSRCWLCPAGEKGNKGKNLLSSLLDLLYTEFLHWLVALYAAKCALEAATDTSLEYQSSAVQLQMLDNIFRASVSVYLYIWRMFTPLSVHLAEKKSLSRFFEYFSLPIFTWNSIPIYTPV